MRILIVAATELEVAPLVSGFEPASFRAAAGGGGRSRAYTCAGHDVDVLTSGVGMVATASWCADALARTPYDMALNLGLCGSFDRALQPGRVVHVVSDCFAELGAEDGDRFLTIQDLGLLGSDEFPFVNGRLESCRRPRNRVLSELATADGITVNKVHGDEPSIAAVLARFRPQVESMEGAAFMYVCLNRRLPFAQVRAVSNVVERRNRAAWRIETAIGALARTARAILEDA
jgi:futalosine hydrolase